jgi:hypothetical protein
MAFVNPFKKHRCPFCAEEWYVGHCPIVSTRFGAAPTPMREAKSSFFARLWVPSLKGQKYTRAFALRQCPNPNCKNSLPLNFGHAETHTIAIIGDTESGKSHYIASCIDQLKKGHAWQVIGCTRIVGQGRTDQTYWDNYYNPVYGQLEQIEATQRASTQVREPLVYEVVFRKKGRFRRARIVNLFFYDSAGGDIREQQRMVHFSHYILNASAIIFLVDPLIVPGIAGQLPDHLKRPSGAPGLEKTADVLNRIIQTFERGQGVAAGTTLYTPIAITISKSDLLKFVMRYGQNPLFLNDAVYGNKLDLRAFDTISKEVQDFLQRAGARELLTSVSSFANKNFFAVSATGWPPDDEDKFPNIEPLRCLDPLLWAFWKLGLIDDE